MDEKKIEEAAEDIFEDKFLGNGEEIIFTNDEGCEDYREEMYHDGQIKEAISLGAHWAIQEFLKGLWHPASEEPKENKPYIYDSPHNSKSYYYVEDDVAKVLEIYHRWNRYVRIYKKHHWCYLDDILPKQKGGEK